jgi:hypothetical protein
MHKLGFSVTVDYLGPFGLAFAAAFASQKTKANQRPSNSSTALSKSQLPRNILVTGFQQLWEEELGRSYLPATPKRKIPVRFLPYPTPTSKRVVRPLFTHRRDRCAAISSAVAGRPALPCLVDPLVPDRRSFACASLPLPCAQQCSELLQRRRPGRPRRRPPEERVAPFLPSLAVAGAPSPAAPSRLVSKRSRAGKARLPSFLV